MNEVQSVPLAAYESLSTRMFRMMRWMITGWALTAIALGLIIVISLSYSDEIMTETVTQEADDYGYNTYAGGDYYYGSETDNYENGGQEETGTGGAETVEKQA